MIRWLCVAVLLAGCGARTGAEVDPAAEREPEPFDAGFDTIPCRWSLAQPTVVDRGGVPVSSLVAAIHAIRDEALLIWERDDSFRGARLILADPPPITEHFGPEIAPDPSLTAIHGVTLHDPAVTWVGSTGLACRLPLMGESPPWEPLVTGLSRSCMLEPQDPARVDLTVLARSEIRLWSASDLTAPVERSVAVEATGVARSVRLDESGWMLFTVEDRTVVVRRVTDDGVERATLGPSSLRAVLVSVSPDRVRGGAVVLRRDEDCWYLERVPLEGPLRATELADLSELSSEPAGSMVTNETEALFPLLDGRVAVVPLDGSAVRFIGPVPAVPRVVLRPGSSGGGLVYEVPEADAHHLVFQPLTCNR